MYKTVFDGKTFDVEKFVRFPKCTRSWGSTREGIGCILTAFTYAFGIETDGSGSIPVIEGDIEPSFCIRDNVDRLASNLGIIKDGYEFSTEIIEYYDNDEEEKALDMIWKLIEVLPNKKGMYNKEDTVMPTCSIKSVTTKEEVPVA